MVMISEAVARAQRTAPVDVEGLAAELGVRVRRAWLGKDISGELRPLERGRFEIVVNAADPETRQRFTIAHELGHFIYHRHLIGSGVGDDRAYRSAGAGIYKNTMIGPAEEREANQFASGLLMPESLLASLRAHDHHDPVELADILQVSVPAMRVRLGLPPRPMRGDSV